MKTALSLCIGAFLLSSSAFAGEITVGMASPLSGPQAYFGTTLQNGFKLYWDKLNAAGGANGTTVKYDQQDDKADPREGTLVAQKFCDNDEIVIGMVNFNSGVAQATLPIYEECSLATMNVGSNPDLTKQGYKFMVRSLVNDIDGAVLSSDYALKTLKAKTVILVNDKQVFGEGVSRIFGENFVKGGGEIVDTLSVAPTDVDFNAIVVQIKRKSPDAVYIGAVMPQLALFTKQMREQGIKSSLLMPDGGFTPDYISQSGEASAQGAVIVVPVPPEDASPEVAEFNKLYREKYGEPAGPYSIYGYVQGQVLEAVLKSTKGLSRAEINEALHAVKAQTVLGEIEFDETGELKVAPSFLYQVEGDKFVMVGRR